MFFYHVNFRKMYQSDKRQNWSREDYKEVMCAFYTSLEKSAGGHTENTFEIWRNRNHNVKMNLNGNKLANVRRDIMNIWTEVSMICLNKVPIVSIQHFILSIPDYRQISFQ